MKIKILMAIALTTLIATSSLANSTKCDHRGNASLFAKTNPPAAKIPTSKTSSTTTRSGVR